MTAGEVGTETTALVGEATGETTTGATAETEAEVRSFLFHLCVCWGQDLTLVSTPKGYHPRWSPSPPPRRRSPSPPRAFHIARDGPPPTKGLSAMFDLPVKPLAGGRRSSSPNKKELAHPVREGNVSKLPPRPADGHGDAEEGEVEEGELQQDKGKGRQLPRLHEVEPTAARSGRSHSISSHRSGGHQERLTSHGGGGHGPSYPPPRGDARRRSPSPPPRSARDDRDRPYAARAPSPAPSGRSRRSGRSTSPPPRRRSPSPYRRPRDHPSPRRPGGDFRRPLSPPPPAGGARRYRSPSPRQDSFQRRRVRSPSPPPFTRRMDDGPPPLWRVAQEDNKSVRPGPPRAGAWGRVGDASLGDKSVTTLTDGPAGGSSSKGVLSPDRPPSSVNASSSSIGRPPAGARQPPRRPSETFFHEQQALREREAIREADRLEMLAMKKKKEEEASRPVGGDEWAARMKARQEQKERSRRGEADKPEPAAGVEADKEDGGRSAPAINVPFAVAREGSPPRRSSEQHAPPPSTDRMPPQVSDQRTTSTVPAPSRYRSPERRRSPSPPQRASRRDEYEEQKREREKLDRLDRERERDARAREAEERRAKEKEVLERERSEKVVEKLLAGLSRRPQFDSVDFQAEVRFQTLQRFFLFGSRRPRVSGN